MSSVHPALEVKLGDELESVQRTLGLAGAPSRLEDSSDEAWYYHLAEIGFWVFLNKERRVYSIRFESPFPFEVDGVRIGDTQRTIFQKLGKPHRLFPVPGKDRWLYDKPRFLRIDFDPKTNRVEKIFR